MKKSYHKLVKCVITATAFETARTAFKTLAPLNLIHLSGHLLEIRTFKINCYPKNISTSFDFSKEHKLYYVILHALQHMQFFG